MACPAEVKVEEDEIIHDEIRGLGERRGRNISGCCMPERIQIHRRSHVQRINCDAYGAFA
jgi:hypothetical protein